MKILLTAINAKYIHSNLAIFTLRASAQKYRDNIELAEFTINNSKDYILEEIYKEAMDFTVVQKKTDALSAFVRDAME